MEQLPEVMRFDDPITMDLGVMAQIVPAVVAWNLAMQLKRSLLDQYEVAQGVATPDNPNPQPFLRRKVIDNG